MRQMEEEEKNFRRSRPRNKQKIALKPVDCSKNIPAKTSARKPKANNTQESKRTHMKSKLKAQRSMVHVTTSKKKLSTSQSTRQRYQTNDS